MNLNNANITSSINIDDIMTLDHIEGIIIEIGNDDRATWFENIKLMSDNKRFYIVNDTLTTIEKYELTHLIYSHISFVSYVTHLKHTILNKPLSLIHLGYINYNNIIQPMDRVEESVTKLKVATDDLCKKIINDIFKHLRNGNIVISNMSKIEHSIYTIKKLLDIQIKGK